MFYCESCGNEFDDPKKVEESRGEFWGAPAYETMYYCPYCGDDDFYEIKEMDYFDKPIRLGDYYYEVTDPENAEYRELYSEESFEENWVEIFDSKVTVEKKVATR